MFQLERNRDAWVVTNIATPFDQYQDTQCSFAIPNTPDTYQNLLGRSDTRIIRCSDVEWRGRLHTEWVLDVTVGMWKTKEREPKRIGLFVRPGKPGLVCGLRTYDPENPSQWLRERVIEYEAGDAPWPAPKVFEEYVTDKTEWVKDKTAAYKPWRTVRHEITEWCRLPSGTAMPL